MGGRSPAVHHRTVSNPEGEAQTEAQEQQEASSSPAAGQTCWVPWEQLCSRRLPFWAQLNLHIWLPGLLQSLGESPVTAPG